MGVNRWQNGVKGFRRFSPSNNSWNQELIEPWKSFNDLASLKSSEIVL
jgi:hypothetical protein